MFEAGELAEMIGETEGVAVSLGSASTWGHHGDYGSASFGAGGGTSSDGGTPPGARVLTIEAGSLPSLTVGSVLTVDGAQEIARGVRTTDFGTLTRVLLASRTHTVSVYRRLVTGVEDEFGQPTAGWDLIASGVSANLEPVDGTVEQRSEGRVPSAMWRALIAGTVELEPDDRVLVTSGVGPPRYRVDRTAQHGAEWDGLYDLMTTEELFP